MTVGSVFGICLFIRPIFVDSLEIELHISVISDQRFAFISKVQQ